MFVRLVTFLKNSAPCNLYALHALSICKLLHHSMFTGRRSLVHVRTYTYVRTVRTYVSLYRPRVNSLFEFRRLSDNTLKGKRSLVFLLFVSSFDISPFLIHNTFLNFLEFLQSYFWLYVFVENHFKVSDVS